MKRHDGNKEPINLHGGWRPDAGRKPSPFPAFIKKFRATEAEQAEFLKMLPGDAREDFSQIMQALEQKQDLIEAIDKYRVAHSAFEASGESTGELHDAYVQLLLSCDLAKALTAK